MATVTQNIRLFLAAVGDRIAPSIKGYDENFERLDAAYHVGRIVMTTNPDWDPNEAFPGTRWVRIQDAFLVGAGGKYPVNATGGTERHFHRTSMGFDGRSWFGYMGEAGNNQGVPYYGSDTFKNVDSLVSEEGWVSRTNVCRIAYTESVPNLPPYRAVFIWERTG